MSERRMIYLDDVIDALNDACLEIDLVLDSENLSYELREHLHQRRGQNRDDLVRIMALPSAQSEDSSDCYNRGYNDAKREIALSGEYERCYERGKADAQLAFTEGKRKNRRSIQR